jgi:hypothetical protein
MGEVYEKIEVTLDRKTLGIISRQLAPGSTAEEVIKHSIARFIETLSKLTVTTATLDKIANLANRPPIKSEADLLKAFEVKTGLSDVSFIVEIDTVVAFPMLLEVAKGQGRSIPDVVRDYISHSAANGGFFTEHIPYRYFNLTPAQYGRMLSALGVEEIRDGEELVNLVTRAAALIAAGSEGKPKSKSTVQ